MLINILPGETMAGDTLTDGRVILSRHLNSRCGNPRATIREWDGGITIIEWCNPATRIDVRRDTDCAYLSHTPTSERF